MRPLRGECARGLGPSAGTGEAIFRADPVTVGWFNSSRQLHTLSNGVGRVSNQADKRMLPVRFHQSRFIFELFDVSLNLPLRGRRV